MPSRSMTISTLLALATAAPMIAMAPQIKREFNPNRDALTLMETNPVDQTAFASLTDWSHPGTLDAKRIQGKVVLLAMISAGDPQSIMTISSLNRMQRDFADQGIVVAAISSDAGFDQLQEKITAGKITIPVARDADGALAKAMHTNDYPDLYLMDRAGNLRFADLDKSSLKSAVKLLTSETTESAVANAELQSKGLAPAPAGAEQPTFAQIDPKLYETADWPEHYRGEIKAKNNIQGQPLPVPLGNEKWIDNERSLEGKVLILDFWATWCPPCKRVMPTLAKIQTHFEGAVEVVGIGGTEEIAKFKKYVIQKKGNYAQMFDQNNTLYRAIGVQAIPHALIISTDGIVRWQGNPLSSDFIDAVNQTVAADPLISAMN